MDLKELGKKIAALGLPLLGGALVPGPAGAALGSVVAKALGLNDDSPETIAVAIQNDPEAAVKLREVETRHKERLEEIAFQRYQAELEAESQQQAQVNETMRSELTAKSGYRAGWRPLFGYLAAIGFFLLICSMVYAIIDQPAKANDIIESAALVLSMMLAVLGINIRARSQDKQAPLPNRPIGLIEAFATRIAK